MQSNRFLTLTAMFPRRGAGLSGALVAMYFQRVVRRAILFWSPDALWCTRLALDVLYADSGMHTLVHRTSTKLLAGGEKGERADKGGEKGFPKLNVPSLRVRTPSTTVRWAPSLVVARRTARSETSSLCRGM